MMKTDVDSAPSKPNKTENSLRVQWLLYVRVILFKILDCKRSTTTHCPCTGERQAEVTGRRLGDRNPQTSFLLTTRAVTGIV